MWSSAANVGPWEPSHPRLRGVSPVTAIEGDCPDPSNIQHSRCAHCQSLVSVSHSSTDNICVNSRRHVQILGHPNTTACQVRASAARPSAEVLACVCWALCAVRCTSELSMGLFRKHLAVPDSLLLHQRGKRRQHNRGRRPV